MQLTPFELEVVETFRKANFGDNLILTKLKGKMEGSIELQKKWFVARSEDVLYNIK